MQPACSQGCGVRAEIIPRLDEREAGFADRFTAPDGARFMPAHIAPMIVSLCCGEVLPSAAASHYPACHSPGEHR